MSGGDDQTGGSREETPTEDTESLNEVVKASEPPILANRRGKVVNGYINAKNKLSRRWDESRTRTENEKYKMRSSDSGLGRTSMEGESSSTERGSESSQDGVSRAAVAAKREEMARLEKELEQEMRYRDTIQWSVDVLQQSVDELQDQLERQDSGHEEESEFKLRCEAQMELNNKLEEQTEWYMAEVEKTKEKINQGQEHTYDQDLDQYNEEYHHLKELIRAYTGDLTVVNRSLEHLWRQRNFGHESGFAGGSTPVTSPGGVKWSGQSGIRPSQRILDPRKGPIRKTVGVRSLPRLDQEELEQRDKATLFRKARSRSRGRSKMRAKSLDAKQKKGTPEVVAPLSPVPRAKSEEAQSVKSSSGVFDESYEASNEASTTTSVELGSDRM